MRSFPKLRVPDLSGGKFWYLPIELDDLKHFVSLNLYACDNLENLADTVRKVHVLKHLNVNACKSLKYLPSRIVGLILQILLVNHCDSLIWAEHTASSMARAESLHDVYTVAVSLEYICGLRNLTKLQIDGKRVGATSQYICTYKT